MRWLVTNKKSAREHAHGKKIITMTATCGPPFLLKGGEMQDDKGAKCKTSY